MQNNTKNTLGSVLIYTLVLVVISLIMALVILWIAGLLATNAELQEITRKLGNNVQSKWNLSIKYSQIVNTNGSGFTDVIGCPTTVTMSGSVHRTTTTPTLGYESWQIFCAGTHMSEEYRIYSASGSFLNTVARYRGDEINIISGNADFPFDDIDTTRMSFVASTTNYSDGIDDDFNSDNYLVSSSWAINYPSLYADDDGDARKLLYGYANPGVGFVNMMWNNSETLTYIENNPNNSDTLTEKIGSMTSSGVLFLDINQDYKLKLYTLDREIFNTSKEIIPLEVYESPNSLWGVGYLQNNSGELGLSFEKTGDEFLFDFTNNDYALFVSNNSTGSLLYTINAQTESGTGVYINPIDDSDDVVIKILANDIIIDNEWRFLYDQFEVIGFK